MARVALYVSAVLLMVTACNAGGGKRSPTKDELLNDAIGRYNLAKFADARRDDQAEIDTGGAVEGLRVSTFKMNKKHFWNQTRYKWVGAVLSNKPYARLRLGAGMNYVYLNDQGDEAHRYVVVPDDNSPEVWYLSVAPGVDLTHKKPGPPLIIMKKVGLTNTDEFVLGGCFECGALHCSTMNAAGQVR